MPYPWQAYPVTGSEIRAAADDTEGRLTSIRGVISDAESEHRGALNNVEGEIEDTVADALSPTIQNASAVEQKAIFAAGCLKFFAHAVDIFNTSGVSPRSVATLNGDWVALPGTEAEKRDKHQGEYEAEFRQLDGNLDDAATETSTMLSAGPTDANIKNLYSAGALPIFAPLIYPDVDFSNQYLPDEQQEELARYVAEHLPDAEPQEAADLIKLLSIYSDDEAFSSTFWKNIEIEEVADTVDRFGYFVFDNPDFAREYPEYAEQYDDLIEGLGVSLATYSKADGEYAMPDGFAEEFGRAITHPEGLPFDDDGQPNPMARNTQPGILTMLLQVGAETDPFGSQTAGFDKDFLVPVAEEIYEFSKTLGNPDHYWKNLSGEYDVGGMGSYSYNGAYDPYYDEESGEWLGGHANADPMGVVLGAMETSRGAAYEFFVENETYDDDGSPERSKYLMTEHDWEGNFEGLTTALDSAMTDESVLDTQAEQDAARRLFSTTAAYLGGNEDFVDSADQGDTAVHMGNIISHYMADVDAAMYPFAENTEADPNGLAITEDPRFGDTRLAVLNLDDLKGLIQASVSTDDGFENMRVGLSAYQNYSIGVDLADDNKLTDDTLNSDARLEGFFTSAVGDQEIEEAADKDKRVAAWIDLGKTLVGAIPIPGADQVTDGLGKYALQVTPSIVLSEAGKDLQQAYASAEDAARANAEDAAGEALSDRADAIAGVLHDNGALTTAEVANRTDNPQLQEQIDSLFQDGFPNQDDYERVAEATGQDPKELQRDINGLVVQALSHELDMSGVSAEDYAQTYKRMFTDYYNK